MTLAEISSWFERIRDIPFSFTQKRTIDALLEDQTGSCTSKHALFVQVCNSRGVRASIAYASFRYCVKDLPFHRYSALFSSGNVFPHTFAIIKHYKQDLYVDLTFDRWLCPICPVNLRICDRFEQLRFPEELVAVAHPSPGKSRREALGLPATENQADQNLPLSHVNSNISRFREVYVSAIREITKNTIRFCSRNVTSDEQNTI